MTYSKSDTQSLWAVAYFGLSSSLDNNGHNHEHDINFFLACYDRVAYMNDVVINYNSI